MEAKERMSVHRALAELKLIDSKLTDKIGMMEPCGIYQKGKKVNSRFELEEFNTKAKADLASIMDNLNRKNRIKKAIVLSNAKTEVTIGSKTMTVADAITHKENIKQYSGLVGRIMAIHKQAISTLEKNNAAVDTNCLRLVEASLGAENSKKEDQAGNVKSITEAFKTTNEFHLADPIGAEKEATRITEEINEFNTSVDAALSESNAVTFIEF